MYFGDAVELKVIKEIDIDSNFNFSYINHEGTLFNKVSSANDGDVHVYTSESTYYGYNYKLYNRSTGSEKAFYVEYVVKNLAVKHEDIGELWMNVLTDNPDRVKDFEMYIHLPNNKDELRVWAHGPLTGYIEKVDINTVKVTIDDLYAGYSIDVRLAFDRDVINSSLKTTTYSDALDRIVEVETKWADEANRAREESRVIAEKERKSAITNSIIQAVIIGLYVGYTVYMYLKYDKEYKPEFKQKYFRDFPSDDTPPTVGYLMRRNVNYDDLSAAILYLIYNKNITFEELSKKDYSLKLENKGNISSEDLLLIDFLFDGDDSTTFSALKKSAKRKYRSFLDRYTKWVNCVSVKAKNKGYYEDKGLIKIFGILFGVLLIISSPIFGNTIMIVSMISIIVGIIGIIYFIIMERRSKIGIEEYHKWRALRNFMNDFGRMDEKELPHVALWEKYLVYALTLGCADNLSRVMKIKVQELNQSGVNTGDIMFDYYRFHALTTFTSQINSEVASTVRAAYSAQSVANSSDSSGFGGGGGFSSGGGFSGGGGGSTGHF